MKKKIYRQDTKSWYLERWVFLIAGIFVLVSAILVLVGITKAIYFTVFVGALLVLFSISGYCPMAIFLNHFGVKEK